MSVPQAFETPHLGEAKIHSRRIPDLADYTLLQNIGSGAYGEVWRAQSATGAMRALKIVWLDRFGSDRPYQREFEGIQRLFDVGRSLYEKSGDYKSATRHFRAAIAADPNFPAALGALAKSLCWGEMDPFQLAFPTLAEVPGLATRALRIDPSKCGRTPRDGVARICRSMGLETRES